MSEEQAGRCAQSASAETDKVICKAVFSYRQEPVGAAVEKIFAACRSTRTLGASSRVLLKPNLLARHRPDEAVTTHPAVLRAVIEALLRRGVKAEAITVADSCGGIYNAPMMKGIYHTAGYDEVCAQTGAQLYTACESGVRGTSGKLVREFSLIRPVLEADYIVNLPKFKTHVMTGYSGAVKNLFGTVPGLQKAEFHMRFPEKENFGDMLVDLCACVAPQLSIMDGIEAMEGDGPAGGTPRTLGLLLGGENPYSLDLAACRIIGLAPARVPYLRAAMARGLCAEELEPSLLEGDVSAAAPVKGYRLPSSYVGESAGTTDLLASTPGLIRWAMPWLERRIAPHPVVRRSLCIGCRKCAQICPAHTITVKNGKAYLDAKQCIRCFCCHEMCPEKAIQVRRMDLFRL